MKTQPDRVEDLRQRRCEADLDATIQVLFRRFPALCGFTVAGALDGGSARELFVTEVSVYPMTGAGPSYALCAEISGMLVELIEEHPLAGELLRERTFARMTH